MEDWASSDFAFLVFLGLIPTIVIVLGWKKTKVYRVDKFYIHEGRIKYNQVHIQHQTQTIISKSNAANNV